MVTFCSRRNSCGVVLTFLAAGSALSISDTAHAQPFSIIARSDGPAAFVPNSQWGTLKLWNVSDARHVCFSAMTRPQPTGPTTQMVTWHRGIQFGNRFLQNDQLPGADQGVLFSGFSEAGVDATGAIVTRATLQGTNVTTANDAVIVRKVPNQQFFAFREGSTPPGFSAGTSVSALMAPLTIAHDGTIAFKALLAGAGITNANNEVTYVRGPQTGGELPVQFLREGDEEVPGRLVQQLGNAYPYALPNAQAISGMQLGPGGSYFGLARGGSSGNNTFLVQTGDSLPWNTPGQTVQTCGLKYAACANGQTVAFEATLVPQGASGIWLTDGVSTVKVAGRNEAVPNVPGAIFNELTASNYPPGLYAGNNGHFALYAGLTGIPSSRGLFTCSFNDPTPRLLVRTGMDVPGFPGLTFLDVDAGRVFIDSVGSVVFSARITGNALNQQWLFTWNHRTGLRVALRPGDAIQVSSIDTRFVQAITLSGSLDYPLPTGRLVSDSGYYAVHVIFTNNTNAILAAQIPGTCNDIDFNNDGSEFDPLDIAAFLSVYSEGPCLPEGAICDSIDFNNEGSLFDPQDIASFLSVYSEGPCL